MAKRKKKKLTTTTKRPFNLTNKANAALNKYLAAIKQGILNVCEMHTHDSNPALSQEDFELTYIEKTLGQTATAVSLSQKAIVEGLAAQKEAEAARALNAAAADKNKSIKQEDN